MGLVFMFRRVLIANRGEIAVRIIRACRELGIQAVVVYSEADAEALHVELADEAVCIGPPQPAQSYLNIERIIEAAKRVGAEAVHPGYGFLAENADFARACAEQGLTFIGPGPEAIRVMGLKAEARRVAVDAGVPVVPGSEGTVRDGAEAAEVARRIGYPLLIKAHAGGGGRGIRVVRHEEELSAALAAAGREAGAAFGNSEVYLERYVEEPRHVEVQILADRHGNVVHLGERECSVQRRRQKIIEEAPSPALTPELRRAMTDAALRIARAIGYVNAGTVEFILDREGNFYFIEMNTRIQVEHPVTEMITGIDIVKLQLAIASGEPLPFRQEDVEFHGWALECRITAEDPERSFLPWPGTITAFRAPSGPGVRVDEGVQSGHKVHPYYDSLLAKVITWGQDREEARRRMLRALHEFRIEGVRTIIKLHQRILSDPRFIAGNVHTRWLEDEFLSAKTY